MTVYYYVSLGEIKISNLELEKKYFLDEINENFLANLE
jgi:hypothetical protein